MSKKAGYKERIIRHFRRTYKNKICVVALILIGILSTIISDDATVLVFTLLIGIPLFFVKDNFVM